MQMGPEPYVHIWQLGEKMNSVISLFQSSLSKKKCLNYKKKKKIIYENKVIKVKEKSQTVVRIKSQKKVIILQD